MKLTWYSITPQSYDCANGVVGVLNPTAEKNLDSYIAAAAANKTIGQGAPRPFGGRLIPLVQREGIDQSSIPTSSLASIMPFEGKLGVDIIAIVLLMLVGVVVGTVCFWISEWMDARLEANEAARLASLSQYQYCDYESDNDKDEDGNNEVESKVLVA